MRVILAGAAIVLLVAGIFLVRPDPVARADDKVCDLLTGWVSRGKPSGQVAIVEIDEQSLAGFGRWPWPRDLLGRVVRRILDWGAATVVLDMMLHEAAANDEVLAGALSGKPVVLGYAFRFDGATPSPSTCALQPLPLVVVGPNASWGAGFFHATGALCSVPELSNAAAGNGFLNAAPDNDGKLRHVPLVMESGDRQYPSLALAAVNVYRRQSAMQLIVNAREASLLRMGAQSIRLEGRSCMRLRFRGARRTFPYVSAASILKDRLPMDTLRGKIAIVGASALGLSNPVVTPLDPLFPEVEVQATAIDNLLEGDAFNRPADFYLWEVVLALLAGLAATLLLALVRSWWSAIIVLGIAVGTWAGCTLLLSGSGLLLSPLPVTAALACSFPVVILLNYVQEKRRAERTQRQLESAEEKTREVLRESESRYQRLVENINDAIIMDDTEGRLVFANRRLREWFGLEGKNLRGVLLEDFAAPEWRDTLRAQHESRMKGGNAPDHFEYEAIRPDGSRIWIEALVTNVEQNGRIAGTQAALRDITERKRMEAQYLQAQKMESIGRLAGGVAHDFNNLLTVINGFCDLLLNRRRDASAYRAGLKEIRAAGERAAELTRNLLAFSRKQLAQPRPLDLNAVISEAEKMFGLLVGEDVDLITRLSPALGQVMADSTQLHQILMNLLVNARDAMPRGGRVVIETKNIEADEDFVRRHPACKPGPYVYLGVTDTGTGMSDEVKRHLFEPFFTTKEQGKGTGLGLATIYGIVQQSGGTIKVASKPDEGSTFHIYLPRVETARPAQPILTDALPAMQGSKTVLVVEDQDAVRKFMRDVLENAGYAVLQAANGREALALAERFPKTIHLLVTDIVLPLMNGFELADTLKTARPEMKVLFTSGYAEETMGSRGIVADDLAYLPKPFSPEQLRSEVAFYLRAPASSKS